MRAALGLKGRPCTCVAKAKTKNLKTAKAKTSPNKRTCVAKGPLIVFRVGVPHDAAQQACGGGGRPLARRRAQLLYGAWAAGGQCSPHRFKWSQGVVGQVAQPTPYFSVPLRRRFFSNLSVAVLNFYTVRIRSL